MRSDVCHSLLRGDPDGSSQIDNSSNQHKTRLYWEKTFTYPLARGWIVTKKTEIWFLAAGTQMDEIFNSCCKYLKGFACKTEEHVKIITNSINELSKNFKGFSCLSFRKIDANVFNKKSPLWGMCVQIHCQV